MRSSKRKVRRIKGFKWGHHYYVLCHFSCQIGQLQLHRHVKLAVDTGATRTLFFTQHIGLPVSIYNGLPSCPVLSISGASNVKIIRDNVVLVFLDQQRNPYTIHLNNPFVMRIHGPTPLNCDGLLGMDVLSKFRRIIINQQEITFLV